MALALVVVPIPQEPMSSTHDPTAVPVHLWCYGDLGRALIQATADATDSRAGFVRKLIADALRQSGHLAPLAPPRRHRGPRQQEAAA